MDLQLSQLNLTLLKKTLSSDISKDARCKVGLWLVPTRYIAKYIDKDSDKDAEEGNILEAHEFLSKNVKWRDQDICGLSALRSPVYFG